MDKSRHKSALTSTQHLCITIPKDPIVQILAAITVVALALSILCLLVIFSSQTVLNDQVPATTIIYLWDTYVRHWRSCGWPCRSSRERYIPIYCGRQDQSQMQALKEFATQIIQMKKWRCLYFKTRTSNVNRKDVYDDLYSARSLLEPMSLNADIDLLEEP